MLCAESALRLQILKLKVTTVDIVMAVLSFAVAFTLSLYFTAGCAAEDVIYGNVSVVLQNLEVKLFMLKGESITGLVGEMLPKSPVIRPPCRTCNPSYNLFQIDNQYLIPNHSRVYVLNPNRVDLPTEVDIGNCDPVQLHSVKSNVVWVQCALQGRLMEIVELRRENNVTWYNHGDRNIRVFSTKVSRSGLLLVKEQDGENITFLYYGDGAGRLVRSGLEDYSSIRYSKPSVLCKTVEELFFINDDLILIQCLLRNTASEHGLVLFNTANPSQTLTIFHNFHTRSMKVHVFENYVVLVSRDMIIIRDAVGLTGFEQLVPLPPEISIDGIFVRLKDVVYFVCTNQKKIYMIDIARVLGGNVTAYHVIESAEEICTDVACSPMRYIGPLLFVPLTSNELAMYTLDPIKLHATADILIDQYYRYFFTYTILTESTTVSNETIIFDATSSEPSKSSRLDAGPIAGIAVAAFVVILIVLIVAATLFFRNYVSKNRFSRLVAT